MKRFTSKTPPLRPPLFWVGDKLYLDLLFNFGHELEVGFADVQRCLVEVPPDSILLARRLDVPVFSMKPRAMAMSNLSRAEDFRSLEEVQAASLELIVPTRRSDSTTAWTSDSSLFVSLAAPLWCAASRSRDA